MKRSLIAVLCLLCTATSLADDFGRRTESRPVRVFDANGHIIGDLTEYSANNGVAFTLGNSTTVVPITRVQDASFHFSATDFKWLAVSFAQFASADCSGDPLIESAWGPRIGQLLRNGSVVTLYFAAPGLSQRYEANSGITSDSFTCNRYASPIPVFGWKSAGKIEITRDHPEPLRIGF